MIKTLTTYKQNTKEKPFKIPRNMQQTIPIERIYEDGIFYYNNQYSKTFKFTDINYAVASKDDKERMFLSYCDILNSFDSGARFKITINNRKLNKEDFEKSVLIPYKDDGLDEYRKEYNDMLAEKITGSSGMVQERFITATILKKDVKEARAYFDRLSLELSNRLAVLSSQCEEMTLEERLKILHDFYRPNDPYFHFDLQDLMQKGHNFKDTIVPDSMEFKKDYFKMGDTYGRVLFLKDYANFLKDTFVTEVCELGSNAMFSIDLLPIPSDEAIREAENKLLGLETNVTNWQRRQNANNNFSAVVPYDMEQQRLEAKEFLDDLTARDQRMMFATIAVVHTADTKEQLDNETDSLIATARKHLCDLAIFTYQQLDGLNTVLPYGVKQVHAIRTLTTESVAVFEPFKVQEIAHSKGIYCGINSVSKNLIRVDRTELLNGNMWALGVPGSGKSFNAKQQIVSLLLSTNADIIYIDAEREMTPLARAFGEHAEIIEMSPVSKNHINPLDMTMEYGDGANPIGMKVDFILSLCEQVLGNTITQKDRSIIDRCANNIYRGFVQNNCIGTPPTLKELHTELKNQPEEEAQDIALALEVFTKGSLNIFSHQTNVNTNARLVVYDTFKLGTQLQTLGMLILLDNIFNRIIENRKIGKETYIFVDEIYLLFMHEYSEQYLYTLWKRVRKFGAYMGGMTQNVGDLLKSHTAKTMLANSEFIIMLNQASTDRLELAKLLSISDTQLKSITNAKAGSGLMKVGKNIVPFYDDFPKDTKLYKLMTTKPSEITLQD